MNPRGRYVVLEGIDGAGKTGLAEAIVPLLVQRGHSVSRFREPTDAYLRAQAARRLKDDPFGAALCFTVDRSILRPEVERALAGGEVVVQDRSFYSNLAYQGPLLERNDWRELERVERALAIEPDLVVYLDVPVELARRRISGRGRHDLFEGADYLEKVRSTYEALFRPPRWVRVDASGSPEETTARSSSALIAAGL